MEEENEKVVEEITQETTEQVDESKFESAGDDSVLKVDLSKPPTPKEDEVKESDADNSGVVASAEDAEPTQEQEEVHSETETQEASILEEITEEEVEEVEGQVEEAIAEAQATGKPLPDNVQKLVDFMSETGGDINDYVKLNQDYSKLDDNSLLKEFYTQTKPHLDNEEINFLMEDQFSFDEDIDEDRDIRRKKLALKEQVASAKSHLDGQKSKYYEEIKMGSKLPDEAQKAMDFFNRYNKQSEENEVALKDHNNRFTKKTEQVFNNKFKGFEYSVGEKSYRFNVSDADRVKTEQSNIDTFMAKFASEDNYFGDKHYHKALFTAANSDAVAKHFYEQGKADAMKDSLAKAKNVDMNPRQAHGKIDAGGTKFKVLGDNSSNYKFKIKNNKFKN